jgi:hypothetical protein
LTRQEAAKVKQKVVLVDANNKILRVEIKAASPRSRRKSK